MNSLAEDYQSTKETEPSTTIKYKDKEEENNLNQEIIILYQKRIIDLKHKQDLSNSLSQRYKQLQTDYEALTEEKIALHYNHKSHRDIFNNQILELTKENEELQQSLNNILKITTQLKQENTTLMPLLQQKTKEISDLNNEIESLSNELTKLKAEQAVFIDLFKEHEVIIEILKEENGKLNKELAQLKNELDTVKVIEETDKKNKERIVEYKKTISSMKVKIEDLKNENNCNKNELNIIKINLDNEKQCRRDREQEINHLNNIIDDIDKELCNYKIKRNNSKSEIKKLKSQVIQVHQQNNRLILAIDNTSQSDAEYEYQSELNRKNRLENVIRENNEIISNSLKECQIKYNHTNSQYQMSNKPTSNTSFNDGISKIEPLSSNEENENENEQEI